MINIKREKVENEIMLIQQNKFAAMGEILTQIEYLSNTTNDFRNFFKPNSQSESYNIKEFVEKCMKLVSAALYENSIEVISHVDENINFCGHGNCLSQAILNILNNAKDALSKVENINKKFIFFVSIKEFENIIMITIKDNAGRIPEDLIQKVFEPYFTTKGEKGTGLGLYITHTIITKKLKGEIYVVNDEFEFERENYKGAKFIITLPSKV